MIPALLEDLRWSPTLSTTRGNRPTKPALLTFRPSLTKAMIREFGPVRITVLNQGYCKMGRERVSCGGPEGLGYTREVLIQAVNRPLIAAVTLLDLPSVEGYFQAVKSLGSRHLGRLLFDNGTLRSDFDFAILPEAMSSYLFEILDLPLCSQSLWVRRSTFSRGTARLILIEIFLPGMNDDWQS